MTEMTDDDKKRPRGRPPKYASSEARQAARRAQVREATRIWRDNHRARQRVTLHSIEDAGRIIDRVINNMLSLAERVGARPEHYPQGFAELLQTYAGDARTAAAHLHHVLDAARQR
jgi:hypothetical protein